MQPPARCMENDFAVVQSLLWAWERKKILNRKGNNFFLFSFSSFSFPLFFPFSFPFPLFFSVAGRLWSINSPFISKGYPPSLLMHLAKTSLHHFCQEISYGTEDNVKLDRCQWSLPMGIHYVGLILCFWISCYSCARLYTAALEKQKAQRGFQCSQLDGFC